MVQKRMEEMLSKVKLFCKCSLWICRLLLWVCFYYLCRSL